jgi:hypothetical protein
MNLATAQHRQKKTALHNIAAVYATAPQLTHIDQEAVAQKMKAMDEEINELKKRQVAPL